MIPPKIRKNSAYGKILNPLPESTVRVQRYVVGFGRVDLSVKSEVRVRAVPQLPFRLQRLMVSAVEIQTPPWYVRWARGAFGWFAVPIVRRVSDLDAESQSVRVWRNADGETGWIAAWWHPFAVWYRRTAERLHREALGTAAIVDVRVGFFGLNEPEFALPAALLARPDPDGWLELINLPTAGPDRPIELVFRGRAVPFVVSGVGVAPIR